MALNTTELMEKITRIGRLIGCVCCYGHDVRMVCTLELFFDCLQKKGTICKFFFVCVSDDGEG